MKKEWVWDYLIKLADYGEFFSIDLAYDDFNKLLDFEIIEDKMRNGLVISNEIFKTVMDMPKLKVWKSR